MSHTLRSVGAEHQETYRRYRDVYLRYYSEVSPFRHRMERRRAQVVALERHLAKLTTHEIVVDLVNSSTKGTSHASSGDVRSIETQLEAAKGKLALREEEARSKIEPEVERGRQFYQSHQAELFRLAEMEAELDAPLDTSND